MVTAHNKVIKKKRKETPLTAMQESSSLPPAAQEWIEQLQLAPHPEGGYYREVSRGNWITANPNGDHRFAYTTIYFLLTSDSPSHLHRIESDEIWFHHAGDPIDIHCIYRTAEDEERSREDLSLARLDPSELPLHTEYTCPSSSTRQKNEGAEKERASPSGGLYEIYKCVTVGYRKETTRSEKCRARPDTFAAAEGEKEPCKGTSLHTKGSGNEAPEEACPSSILQWMVPRQAIFGSTLHPRGHGMASPSSPSSAPEHAVPKETSHRPHGFTVVSCVVAPGFDFKDFKVFTQEELLSICPQHESIIRQLAYEKLPSPEKRQK